MTTQKVKNSPRHVVEPIERRAGQPDEPKLQRGTEAKPLRIADAKLAPLGAR